MTNKRMKRCSVSQIIRIMEITSHWSEWPLSRSLKMINAGEGVEKREPSYAVVGNVNWYSHFGEQCGGSFKN